MRTGLKLPSPEKIHDFITTLRTQLRRRDVLIIPAYLALYLVLEQISFVHQFGGLGLTLWNPPPALSLALLLTFGFRYLPLLFVAALLTGEVFQLAPHSWTAKLLSSVALAIGYGVMALLLRSLSLADLEAGVLSRTLHVLLVVPAGVLAIATLYCGALLLTQALLAEQFLRAVRHFWIGDTIGIVTLLPALLASLAVDVRRLRDRDSTTIRDTAIFVLGVGVALALIFGGKSPSEFQFFYLLFPPVIWIAIRHGYTGAALCGPLVHSSLVLVTVLLAYDAGDFMAFQMLMLALSATGLLLGAAISDRQLSEKRLRGQQADLQRMSRIMAVGGMGTALAHELSQPLSTVATYVHVGRKKLATPQPDLDAVDENLGKALQEAQRARQVLKRLRDFISRGHLELVPVNLTQTSLKIAALSRSEASERGVSVKLDSSATAVIDADPIQIEQALLNLISNAVDAAADRKMGGGAVVIRVCDANGQRRVEVEDNGPGIASDIADRLFEPFETSKPRGMGLGLALSRQIIDAHGGRLWWEPVEPQGSKFVIEFGVSAESRHER
jgi:signal transduction histidine kinase